MSTSTVETTAELVVAPDMGAHVAPQSAGGARETALDDRTLNTVHVQEGLLKSWPRYT